MSVHKELYESDPSGDILPAAHAAAPALVRPRRHLVYFPHIRHAGHRGDRSADVARSAPSPLGVPPCRHPRRQAIIKLSTCAVPTARDSTIAFIKSPIRRKWQKMRGWLWKNEKN